MQQQSQANTHTLAPTLTTTTRPPRLLYRRGLPDLPELIEQPEEDEVTTVPDDVPMNTCSTRHSTGTSVSSRDFPSNVQFSSPKAAIRRQLPVAEAFTNHHPSCVYQFQTSFV